MGQSASARAIHPTAPAFPASADNHTYAPTVTGFAFVCILFYRLSRVGGSTRGLIRLRSAGTHHIVLTVRRPPRLPPGHILKLESVNMAAAGPAPKGERQALPELCTEYRPAHPAEGAARS